MRIFFKFKLLKFITCLYLLAFGLNANNNALAKPNTGVKNNLPKKAKSSSTKGASVKTSKQGKNDKKVEANNANKKVETSKKTGTNKKTEVNRKDKKQEDFDNKKCDIKKSSKQARPTFKQSMPKKDNKDYSANQNFNDNLNRAPAINALGAILVDGRTNDVIYEKNADRPAPMASTTKIMTALLACEYVAKTAKLKKLDANTVLDDIYPVHEEAVNQNYLGGTSLMGLKSGDSISMRGLLYGLMFLSGNDAANEIAIRVSGSIVEFVKLMNKRCESLGLKNTSYSSPSGLGPEDVVYIKNLDNKTTARELALLMSYIFKNSKTLRKILETPSLNSERLSKMWRRNDINIKREKLELYSQHKFLHRGSRHFYEYSCGGKTGFTDKAGRCLVSVAKKNDVPLVAVVLNCHEHWEEVRKMFDYGFSQYIDVVLPTDLSDAKSELENLKLKLCGEDDRYFKVKVNKPCKISVKKSALENNEIKYKIVASPIYFGKLKEGDTVGKIEYYLKDKLVAKTSLLAAEDVSADES